MPLHDTPWERGKCAYELLQAMAAGKPVIASRVGANRQAVRHCVNGFLAETTEEWADALGKLADPELRRRMGGGGKQYRCRAIRRCSDRAMPGFNIERGDGRMMCG
jgi:glycosyltransferase involved in cell wall biosynthesis